MPADSKILVNYNGISKEFIISDLISENEVEGKFYAENIDLEGNGEGYGIKGKKEAYPDVGFKLEIEEKENKGQSGDKTEGQAPEQVPEPETEFEIVPEQTPEPSPEPEITAPESTTEPTITGAAVSEFNTISGTANKDNEFTYQLGEGQTASLVQGSVKVNDEIIDDGNIKIKIRDNEVIVTTDYFTEEEGFGSEFIGNDKLRLEIDVGRFGLVAENTSSLDIKLSYNDVDIIETREDINVDEPGGEAYAQENAVEGEATAEEEIIKPIANITEANITGDNVTANISIANQTLVNETIVNITAFNITVNTIQYEAKLGERVRWFKKIETDKSATISVELPESADIVNVVEIRKEIIETEEEFVDNESEKEEVGITMEDNIVPISGQVTADLEVGKENIFSRLFKRLLSITGRATEEKESKKEILLDINESESGAEIEYYTDAPYSAEEEIRGGKKVRVFGADDIHYENVLIFAGLNESLNIINPEKIRIYWEENATYLSPLFVNDTDGNGIYDYIEWIAPSLSNQTFLIIVITKAEHLDENRIFISDIYNEAKELDNVWSETIPDRHYVRVRFERNLTSQNDITLFPRVISGSLIIEVYENNGTELIAQFNNLISNGYNKVFLTNLQNSQDTFDLRVLNGSLEFDYIVDPATGFRFHTIDAARNLTWTTPGNANVSDNLYAVSGISCSTKHDFYGFGFAVPAQATIEGVNVTLEHKHVKASDTGVYFVQLLNSTRDLIGNEKNNTNHGHADDATNESLGGATDTWGATLTSTIVNSTNFGVSVCYNKTAGGGGNKLSVDMLQINVFYSTEDTTPPQVTINHPLNTTLKPPILFNVTTNENANYSNYTLNNGLFNYTMQNNGNRDFNATNSSIAEGQYTARYFVWDTVGNLNATTNITFSVDQTLPIVTIIRPENITYSFAMLPIPFNISTNENSTANFTLTNGLVNYTMTMNGSGNAFNYTNGSIADGQYVTRYFVNDIAGNFNGTTNITFSVEATIPQLSIVYPVNNSLFTTNNITVNYTISDLNLQACWYTNNSGLANTTVTCGQNISRLWNEGINNVTIYANDTANNVNSSTITFTIDTLFPQLSIVYPVNDSFVPTKSITVNYTVSDNALHTCWYTNSSGTVNYSITCGQNVSGIWIENINNVTIYANDSARNINSSTITFNVDTIFPNLTITRPENVTYTGLPIPFNISVSENSTANYTLTNGVLNYTMTRDGTFTVFNSTNASIADGQYTSVYHVFDRAGNFNGSANVTFSVITAAQSITISECGNVSSAGNYALNQSINSSSTCLNITTSHVSIDGAGFVINYSQAADGFGVVSNNTQNVTIKNIVFRMERNASNSAHAINITHGKNYVIENNTIFTAGDVSSTGHKSISGVNLSYSIISYNTINNSQGRSDRGIELKSKSENNTVSHNIIYNDRFSARGISISSSVNNTLFNNTIYLYSTGTVSDTGGGLVIEAQSNSTQMINNTVKTDYIVHPSAGIGISLSDYSGNPFADLIPPVSILDSPFSSMTGNNLTSSGGNSIKLGSKTAQGYNVTIDSTNFVENKPVNFTKEAVSLVLQDINSNYGQIIIAGSSNITINRSNISTEGIAIYNSENITITNLNISALSGGAIWLADSRNAVIENNTIVTNSSGGIMVWASFSRDIRIRNISLSSSSGQDGWGFLFINTNYSLIAYTSVFTTSSFSQGYALKVSYNNTLINVSAQTWGQSSSGFISDGSFNTLVINSSFLTTQRQTAYGLRFFTNQENTTFVNVNATANTTLFNAASSDALFISDGSSKNVRFIDSYLFSNFNHTTIESTSRTNTSVYFLNTTLNTSRITIVGNGTVYRQWYLDANVTSGGSALSGAQVNGTLANTTLAFGPEITAASGYITRQNLTEFHQNITGTFSSDYNNHTIYANKSGYTSNSTSINVTANQRVWLNLVSGNIAPINSTFIFINSTLGTNRTAETINCYTNITDADSNGVNITVRWINNSVQHLTFDYNNSYASGSTFIANLTAGNTTRGENWSCSLRLFDGIDYSAWLNSTNLTILNTPPSVPSLTSPADWTQTTDRTPDFTWGAIIDDDADTVTYEHNISVVATSTCSDSKHTTGIATNAYTQSYDLRCLIDNGDYYNWTVRSYDSIEFSAWRSPFRVNISALINITLVNNSVIFGSLAVGAFNDTADNSPDPLRIRNEGNVYINVTAQATSLWQTSANPTAFYRFKADNYTLENLSFSWSQSVTTFTNVPAQGSPTLCLAQFNYTDARDEAEVDLYVETPSANEGSGFRNSTLTFTASLSE